MKEEDDHRLFRRKTQMQVIPRHVVRVLDRDRLHPILRHAVLAHLYLSVTMITAKQRKMRASPEYETSHAHQFKCLAPTT